MRTYDRPRLEPRVQQLLVDLAGDAALQDQTRPVDLKGSPPAPVYVGPIPDLARVDGTAARPAPERLTILSRRWLQFGTAPSCPTTQIAIGPLMNTEAWRSGLLVARLHAIDTFPSTTQVYVRVQGVDVSSQDPSKLFIAATPLASVFFRNSDTAPKLLRGSFVPGRRIRLVLEGVCGAPTPIGTLRVAISVEVVGRYE